MVIARVRYPLLGLFLLATRARLQRARPLAPTQVQQPAGIGR
jgi:hypothetical protein